MNVKCRDSNVDPGVMRSSYGQALFQAMGKMEDKCFREQTLSQLGQTGKEEIARVYLTPHSRKLTQVTLFVGWWDEVTVCLHDVCKIWAVLNEVVLLIQQLSWMETSEQLGCTLFLSSSCRATTIYFK